MKRSAAAFTLLLWAHLVGAAPDLLKMAAEENYLTPALQLGLDQLQDGEIDQIRDAEGLSLLHCLARRSHQVRALLVILAGADVNARDHRGRTPLFDVMEANDPYWKGDSDFMLLETLVLRGADVNARAADGSTPLTIAVARDDCRKAEFLIWRGADLKSLGSLATISAGREEGAMKALLTAAMKPGLSGEGATAMRSQAARRADRLTKALTAADLNATIGLLDEGWNINEQNEKGRTALFQAVQTCRPDLVSLLLFEGADPDIPDREGRTPLMLSSSLLSIEGQRMMAMLLLKGADVNATNKKGETALIASAAAGHDIGVISLIAAGADPLAPTPKGSVMNYVTHPPTMSVLMEFGVPSKDKATEKPEVETAVSRMVKAADAGNLAEVEMLLQSGVPADAMDSKERTAMSLAVNSGHFDVVDLLIRRGASINLQYPKNGWHMLHYLVGWPRPPGDEVNVGAVYIEKLIERGANPNIRMKDGTTPLMIAAKAGIQEATTEALLKGGADLNLRNKAGFTAVAIARKHGRIEMAEFLKARGGVE